MRWQSTHVTIVTSALLLVLLAFLLNGCLFGLFKGSDKSNPASLRGVVVSRAKNSTPSVPRYDTLKNGSIAGSFNGMVLKDASTAIKDGYFVVRNLYPGCCFRMEIHDPKTGQLIAIDSSITLHEGENQYVFYVANSAEDTVMYLPGQPAIRIIAPVRKGH